ncbi:MAG: hypothetical protein ACOC5G_02625 [Acidobacteriota bacterium]
MVGRELVLEENKMWWEVKKYDPIKFTDQDKEEILDRMPETGQINLKERIEFPKYYPAFQNFTIDEKGQIFVRTFEERKKEGE